MSKNNPVGKYNQRALHSLSVFDSIQVKIKKLLEESVGFPTAFAILLEESCFKYTADILKQKEELFQVKMRAEEK